MNKEYEIPIPSSIFNDAYTTTSATLNDMKQAYYTEQRDKFLKYITAKPRRRKRK